MEYFIALIEIYLHISEPDLGAVASNTKLYVTIVNNSV